jgi:hypothetical protein
MILKNTMPRFPAQPSSICQLDALKRYLKLRNWILEDLNESSLTYTGPVDDLDQSIRLVLPTSTEFQDAPSMIAKAIKLLSAIEQCSVDSMCQAVMNSSSDFLRPRILTPSNNSNISLDAAKTIISNLHGLVYYSACLEEDSQPFFARGRSIGKKYVDRCRFGQTFPGSYGVTIEMPMAPSSRESVEQMPFERRIMIRIARGLHTIQKASQEADVSVLTNAYNPGFNANLYETMQSLMQSLQECQIEFAFTWSPEYIVPPELVNMPAIRMTPASVIPFLESAAKFLRRSSESQDAIVIGKIIQLRGSEEVSEEGDDLDSSGGHGTIVIEWETEKGRRCLIRAVLSQEDYRLACNAHRDDLEISIKGKPEKPGKYLILTSPADFRVLKKDPGVNA